MSTCHGSETLTAAAGATAAQERHEVLLEVSHLTKRFPQILANDQVDLQVRKGEIHCLLGENGAGKTTLAECIFGFYQPDSGEIRYHGSPVTFSSPNDAINRRIGMVHQRFMLVQPHSVVENIVLGLNADHPLLDLGRAEQRLQELCRSNGVDLDPRAKIWQLSVAEQQWVEILKALYVGVDLLILDEPTAVLTPQETGRLFKVLKQMSQDGLSILFITHKLSEVMALSDRVTVLRKGRLIGTVNTRDVTKEELATMMVGREVIFRVVKEPLESGKPLLEVKDLRVLDDRGLVAVQALNLTVHEREILGIAGVSGNGQRELFDALVGARRAEQGEIWLRGENIANRSPGWIMSRGVAHVPADRIREGLILDFSIAENLILGREWKHPYRKGLTLNDGAIQELAKRSLSQYEIQTPSSGQRTRNLSGGNLQKVILARELGHSPRVLLAYQPCRGLDVGVIEYVHAQILQKRAEGVGILLVSEDLEEIFNLADMIAVMYRGRIVGMFRAADARLDQVGLLMAGIT